MNQKKFKYKKKKITIIILFLKPPFTIQNNDTLLIIKKEIQLSASDK